MAFPECCRQASFAWPVCSARTGSEPRGVRAAPAPAHRLCAHRNGQPRACRTYRHAQLRLALHARRNDPFDRPCHRLRRGHAQARSPRSRRSSSAFPTSAPRISFSDGRCLPRRRCCTRSATPLPRVARAPRKGSTSSTSGGAYPSCSCCRHLTSTCRRHGFWKIAGDARRWDLPESRSIFSWRQSPRWYGSRSAKVFSRTGSSKSCSCAAHPRSCSTPIRWCASTAITCFRISSAFRTCRHGAGPRCETSRCFRLVLERRPAALPISGWRSYSIASWAWRWSVFAAIFWIASGISSNLAFAFATVIGTIYLAIPLARGLGRWMSLARECSRAGRRRSRRSRAVAAALFLVPVPVHVVAEGIAWNDGVTWVYAPSDGIVRTVARAGSSGRHDR